VRAVGLEPRRRIGPQCRVVVELEPVPRAGGDAGHEAAVIAVGVPTEHDLARVAALDDEGHARPGRCPHPDVRAMLSRAELGTDRESSGHPRIRCTGYAREMPGRFVSA
jgi:hypothetical protein